MTGAAVRHELIDNPDGSRTRYSYFDASEETLVKLMDELFKVHWARLTIGPWMLGAVFELTFDTAPEVTMHNGYLNIDAGSWHCHLCIGKYKGGGAPESHVLRRVAKIAFYDWRGDGSIKERSSGIQMWNGYGEQMKTIFFPHVLLGATPHTVGPPNWENLRLYYEFRQRYLGEAVPEDMEKAGRAPLT
ncbi:MAG: hypothetical protein N2444_10620, partial [Methylocystis sp.]|nr:hypothetical protein [Methylocystis sp.]